MGEIYQQLGILGGFLFLIPVVTVGLMGTVQAFIKWRRKKSKRYFNKEVKTLIKEYTYEDS